MGGRVRWARWRVFRWLACVVVFGVLAGWGLPVFGVLRGGSRQFQARSSEYERANTLFLHATGQRAYYGVQVLLRARRGVLVARAVGGVRALLARQGGFERVLDWRIGRRRAAGWGGVLVMAAFASPVDSVAAAARIRGSVSSSSRRGWRIRILVGGPDVAFGELEARTRVDAERVELIAAPLLLVLCFLVFGGLACVVPMVVGLGTVLLAFAVLRLLDWLGVGLSIYALPAVTGLAVGLSVDYSLLMLGRYREEIGVGARPRIARGRMLATAGRTVLLSSVTIAAAVMSLLVFPLQFLGSIGLAAAVTALAAGVTVRLVVPVAIGVLGVRVDSGSRVINGRACRVGRGPSWRRLSCWVTRRPVLVACAAIMLLLAAGTPMLGLRLLAPSAQLLPADAQSRQLEDLLAKDRAPDAAAAIYTVYKPPPRGVSAGTLAAEQARIAGPDAEIVAPRYIGRGTWELSLLAYGSPDSPGNQRLLADIQAVDARAGALAGGITAFAVDQSKTIAARLPLALAIVALVVAGALWLASGSVVIAGKGVLMAVLSAAAGIGLLVVILGRLEEADLLFMTAVALALSADYELFLISRIAEGRRHGLSNTQAIVAGVQRTGPLISSAAFLFVAAVAPLALTSLSFAKQFGLGAVLTVAVDASIVRVLLVPSLMVLLGERNWWAPGLLRSLHEGWYTPRGAPEDEDCQDLVGDGALG